MELTINFGMVSIVLWVLKTKGFEIIYLIVSLPMANELDANERLSGNG
jgi:hypothetical protein